VRSVEDVLNDLYAATPRLLHDAERIPEDELRQPSLLPGWSRAHVLAHLAQNAEAGTRLLRWARTGVRSFEYPSVAAREAAIQHGAQRPLHDLVEQLRVTAAGFSDACGSMNPEQWERVVTWTTGQDTPAHVVARSRLTEVLVHHVDLDRSYRGSSWPTAFVRERLVSVVQALNRRRLSPQSLRLEAVDSGTSYDLEGATPRHATVTGADAELLLWLLGRSRGDALVVSDGRRLPVMPSTYTT
jgi:maleylpyruvate isomerase